MIGEFLGWFIGWNLTLEYAFAAAALAGKWSLSLKSLLMSFYKKDEFPDYLNCLFGTLIYEDYNFRLSVVAPALILILGLIVNRGVSMSTRFTNFATILNLSLIAFTIIVGWFSVDYSNWNEWIPEINVEGAVPPFTRIINGSSKMFFCFIGYDTVSTLSVDAINPSRDIPIAAFLTIGTATGLYALVGLVLTGMTSSLPRTDTVLADAFTSRFSSYTVKIVSLMNMAVTVFACILGQPKIFAAISRDGLLPKSLAHENSRGVPTRSVMATLLLTAGITAVYDVDKGIIDMIAAGCLFSMSIVCAGMLSCRFNNAPGKIRNYGYWSTVVFFVNSLFFCWSIQQKQSNYVLILVSLLMTSIPACYLIYIFATRSNDLKPLSATSDIKSFVCPFMPIVPCLAILANNYVLVGIEWNQIALFIAWAIIGISIYLGYGLHNSKLGQEIEAVESFGKF